MNDYLHFRKKVENEGKTGILVILNSHICVANQHSPVMPRNYLLLSISGRCGTVFMSTLRISGSHWLCDMVSLPPPSHTRKLRHRKLNTLLKISQPFSPEPGVESFSCHLSSLPHKLVIQSLAFVKETRVNKVEDICFGIMIRITLKFFAIC